MGHEASDIFIKSSLFSLNWCEYILANSRLRCALQIPWSRLTRLHNRTTSCIEQIDNGGGYFTFILRWNHATYSEYTKIDSVGVLQQLVYHLFVVTSVFDGGQKQIEFMPVNHTCRSSTANMGLRLSLEKTWSLQSTNCGTWVVLFNTWRKQKPINKAMKFYFMGKATVSFKINCHRLG